MELSLVPLAPVIERVGSCLVGVEIVLNVAGVISVAVRQQSERKQSDYAKTRSHLHDRNE